MKLKTFSDPRSLWRIWAYIGALVISLPIVAAIP